MNFLILNQINLSQCEFVRKQNKIIYFYFVQTDTKTKFFIRFNILRIHTYTNPNFRFNKLFNISIVIVKYMHSKTMYRKFISFLQPSIQFYGREYTVKFLVHIIPRSKKNKIICPIKEQKEKPTTKTCKENSINQPSINLQRTIPFLLSSPHFNLTLTNQSTVWIYL